jgi:SPOR domain
MTAHDVAFEDTGPSRYLEHKRRRRRRGRLAAGGAVLILAGATFALWPTSPAPMPNAGNVETTPPRPAVASSPEKLLAPSEGESTPILARSSGLQPGFRLVAASAPEMPPGDAVAAAEIGPPEAADAPPPAPSAGSPAPSAVPGGAEPAGAATERPAPPSRNGRPPAPSAKPAGPAAAAARPSVAKPVYLQLSAFSDESNARREISALRASLRDVLPGIPLKIDRGVVDHKPIWRLRAGPFATPERGAAACSRIKHRSGACLVIAS